MSQPNFAKQAAKNNAAFKNVQQQLAVREKPRKRTNDDKEYKQQPERSVRPVFPKLSKTNPEKFADLVEFCGRMLTFFKVEISGNSCLVCAAWNELWKKGTFAKTDGSFSRYDTLVMIPDSHTTENCSSWICEKMCLNCTETCTRVPKLRGVLDVLHETNYECSTCWCEGIVKKCDHPRAGCEHNPDNTITCSMWRRTKEAQAGRTIEQQVAEIRAKHTAKPKETPVGGKVIIPKKAVAETKVKEAPAARKTAASAPVPTRINTPISDVNIDDSCEDFDDYEGEGEDEYECEVAPTQQMQQIELTPEMAMALMALLKQQQKSMKK